MLDFVMKVAQSVSEGSEEIQKAMTKSKDNNNYPKTKLGTKLKWIARLIKRNLNSKVYYTSLGGFDTHDNQLPLQNRKLTELDRAISNFYKDLKNANFMKNTTIVVFFRIRKKS